MHVPITPNPAFSPISEWCQEVDPRPGTKCWKWHQNLQSVPKLMAPSRRLGIVHAPPSQQCNFTGTWPLGTAAYWPVTWPLSVRLRFSMKITILTNSDISIEKIPTFGYSRLRKSASKRVNIGCFHFRCRWNLRPESEAEWHSVRRAVIVWQNDRNCRISDCSLSLW